MKVYGLLPTEKRKTDDPWWDSESDTEGKVTTSTSSDGGPLGLRSDPAIDQGSPSSPTQSLRATRLRMLEQPTRRTRALCPTFHSIGGWPPLRPPRQRGG